MSGPSAGSGANEASTAMGSGGADTTEGGVCVDTTDEPNDTPIEAILLLEEPADDLDVLRSAALCPGDVDYYSFSLSGENYLIVEARFEGDVGSVALSVITPNGVQWLSQGGRIAVVHRRTDGGGEFQIRVEHITGTGLLPYELRVRPLPAGQG